MYPRDRVGNAGKVTGLFTYYSILNRLFRKTLTLRDGNPSDISAHAKNLMSRMQPDPRGGDFSVGDFIWEEIKHISETPLKTCGYAPYIMRVILKVTRRNFGMDVKHEPLRIKHPKHVRVPSACRYDEVQEEDQEDHGPLPDQDADAQQHAQDVPQQEEPAGGFVPHEGRDVSPPRRSSSSFRRMFRTFVGMIKNQRDILVNQERERKNNKKLRDNQKRMYTAMQLKPPLSPISPELEAAENPSLDQMIESFQGIDFGQYDHLGEQMFFGQESQPGGLSSAQQFTPQFHPGSQLFSTGPQMFA